MGYVGFAPDIAFSLVAKKFNFSLMESMECTAYCDPMHRYTSLCCGTLQLLQGYLLVSALPFLINALLARSVSFGGRPLLAGLLWYHVLSI